MLRGPLSAYIQQLLGHRGVNSIIRLPSWVIATCRSLVSAYEAAYEAGRSRAEARSAGSLVVGEQTWYCNVRLLQPLDGCCMTERGGWVS